MKFEITHEETTPWIATVKANGGIKVTDPWGAVRNITPAYVKAKGSPLEALEKLYRGDKYSREVFLRITQVE